MKRQHHVAVAVSVVLFACGEKEPPATDESAPLGTLSHAQLRARHGGLTAGEWDGCVSTANCGEVAVPRDRLGATHLYWSGWWTLWIWTNDADVVVRVCVPDGLDSDPAIVRDRFWRARNAIPVALGADVLNRMITEEFYAERRITQQVSASDDAPKLRITTQATSELPGTKVKGGDTTCWEIISSSARR